DIRVFGFALLISLLTGIACGLAPALQASQQNLTVALKQEGVDSGDWKRGSRLRDVLVVAQVAECLILLVSAGLLVRGLRKAYATDPGFNLKNVVVVQYNLRDRGYDQPRTADFHRQLLERLPSLPGVKSAAVALRVPLYGPQSVMVNIGAQPVV